jgi:osmotically-inducible protein OsmY
MTAMTATAGAHMNTDDAALRAAVAGELQRDPAVPTANVGVSVTDHTVTLSGTVHSFGDRVAAVRAAERVDGVHVVVDEILVLGAMGTAGSDEEIGRVVERILESSTDVRAAVRDGIIELTGTVGSEQQRDAAERAVRNVKHVLLVRNGIVVDDTPA